MGNDHGVRVYAGLRCWGLVPWFSPATMASEPLCGVRRVPNLELGNVGTADDD